MDDKRDFVNQYLKERWIGYGDSEGKNNFEGSTNIIGDCWSNL